ncbi:MAG: YitT family protein [Oscillospiraceae bacterium]|jgi:uncharacterized membrane-anchored protein YitT (DUF2179 family)|nr:YitT family protein [Oscillospiraceae bacterium]
MSKKITTFCLDVLICGLGACIYAVALNTFTIPNQIAPGGFSGIATILNFIWDFPVGVTLIVLNAPLMVISWRRLGMRFIVKTIAVTVAVSVLIDISSTFLPAYNDDRLLASLFGGVLSGAGLAMIFLRGATSGGTDILAKLMRIRWPHMSMGRIIMLSDLFVVSASGIVFKSLESALYAIIIIFVSSRVIDYVLYGTGRGKMLMVFTDNAQEIANAITKDLTRGVSIVDIKGGYTGKHKYMLICAVRNNEVSSLSKIIKQFDEQPFMIVSEVGEIWGQGFLQEESI